MYLKEIPCVNKVTIPYDTVAKRWEVNVKVQHNTLLCCMELIRTGGGGVWVLPMIAYTERLHLKGVYLQLYERVRISLVEVYKRVGKSVIWVCKRAQKGLQMNIMALKGQQNVLFL